MTQQMTEIRDRLVEKGTTLFESRYQPIQFIKSNQFTQSEEANALLNNLEYFPHAFVLGCIMDRQITAERAWMIPYLISQKIGGFTMERLCDLSLEDVHNLMNLPTPLHRFVNEMPRCFHSAIQRIRNEYQGNAALIWSDNPSSRVVVKRFRNFLGVGQKIANMAPNILARQFKIPFADYNSIDIAADVHVHRVFRRLGLCPAQATIEDAIYKARELSPDFPGMMDFPCWEIGKEWCHANNPECGECYMRDLCPTAERN